MSRLTAITRSFGAIQSRNFRLWFAGQAISVSGTWMQATALGWLVIQLGGDGVELGVVMSLQYLPLMVFGPWGGSIVDRVDVRRAVIITQAATGVLAFALWALSFAGIASIPLIYLLALLTGVAGIVDNPARRAFVSELVGPETISSAISLNGVLVNSARVVGPALAAIIIALAGVVICFLLNAISYACVVGSLLAMRKSELIPREGRSTGPLRMRDTLQLVRRMPVLRQPLISMALVGTLAFEFNVVLPLLASDVFMGDGSTYGAFLAVLSVGAIFGSLGAGVITDPSGRWHEMTLVLFGIGLFLCAVAPTLPLEFIALFLMGMAGFAYSTVAATSIQLHAGVEHRGRILALWSMAFLGSTMIGAPIIGWVSAAFGSRMGLAVGAASAILAALLIVRDRRTARADSSETTTFVMP